MAGADRELSILSHSATELLLSQVIEVNQDGIFQVGESINSRNLSGADYLALLERITPSYLVWNHFMASSLVRRWGKPTLPTCTWWELMRHSWLTSVYSCWWNVKFWWNFGIKYDICWLSFRHSVNHKRQHCFLTSHTLPPMKLTSGTALAHVEQGAWLGGEAIMRCSSSPWLSCERRSCRACRGRQRSPCRKCQCWGHTWTQWKS